MHFSLHITFSFKKREGARKICFFTVRSQFPSIGFVSAGFHGRGCAIQLLCACAHNIVLACWTYYGPWRDTHTGNAATFCSLVDRSAHKARVHTAVLRRVIPRIGDGLRRAALAGHGRGLGARAVGARAVEQASRFARGGTAYRPRGKEDVSTEVQQSELGLALRLPRGCATGHEETRNRKQRADFKLGDGSAAGTGGDDGDEEILLDEDIESD